MLLKSCVDSVRSLADILFAAFTALNEVDHVVAVASRTDGNA